MQKGTQQSNRRNRTTAWTQSAKTDLKQKKWKGMNKLRATWEIRKMPLGMFGRDNIAAQLDEGCRTGIWRQRGGWLKQHISSEIIDCGEIERALLENDESECSETPTVFIRAVDFVAADAAVQEHLRQQHRMNSQFWESTWLKKSGVLIF